MAVYNESGGSMEGLELADDWSRKGKKYKGIREIRTKWTSFRLDHPHPVTIASLIRMVADNGHDCMEICSAAEGQFTPIGDAEGDA